MRIHVSNLKYFVCLLCYFVITVFIVMKGSGIKVE